MPASLRRLRGRVLRLAHSRTAAVTVGAALLVPSLVLMFCDLSFERWWTDGLTLVAGATGAAFIAIGIGGRGPDWEEP